jgi:hypothetical protein
VCRLEASFFPLGEHDYKSNMLFMMFIVFFKMFILFLKVHCVVIKVRHVVVGYKCSSCCC